MRGKQQPDVHATADSVYQIFLLPVCWREVRGSDPNGALRIPDRGKDSYVIACFQPLRCASYDTNNLASFGGRGGLGIRLCVEGRAPLLPPMFSEQLLELDDDRSRNLQIGVMPDILTPTLVTGHLR